MVEYLHAGDCVCKECNDKWERVMEKPVIVRTYIHLMDRKGWKREEERPGDFCCGSRYIERKRFNYRDAVLPIGKFDEPDYPPSDSLRCMDYEFELQREDHEPIYAHYYFKHLYFQEL